MAGHRYRALCDWSGTTAGGYDSYDRGHTVTCPPAGPRLTLTSDRAFLGDPTHLNPEQLLLAAAVSCQLLSFLAVAARARIVVLEYHDDADADMPERPRPMRITEIRLRPHVTVAAGTDTDRIHALVGVAHRECFIANTLACPIDVQATVETT